MKHRDKKFRRELRALVALVLAAGASRAAAGITYYEEPLPSINWPQLKYIDMDVEADQSTTTAGNSRVSYQRLYLSPQVGIGWDSYLYHPDLLTFQILAEPGYVWQDSGSTQSMSKENDVLLNGTLTANLLQLKDYASTIFAQAGHDTRQYDFYNSVVEDVQSYGITTGYRAGPIPFSVTAQHSETESSGLTYNSTSDQTSINLHASNTRNNGNNTDLLYQFQDWTWLQTGGINNSSVTHNVTLTDAEHWGNKTLTSTLYFNDADYTGDTSDNITPSLDLVVEHTPHLRTFYDYNANYYTTGGGDSFQNNARIGVQHQLYDSLFSSADIHGSTLNSTYSGSSLDSDSAGVSASVNYAKRLGEWGHLTLDAAGTYDYTEQESGGTALLVADESHQLTTGMWVPLNQPRDINDSVFKVTTASHVLLTEGTDYYVDRTKDPWLIQISPFSLLITSGATVLVTYDVQPNPSGGYTTVTDNFQARLDLWHGLLDFYARYNQTMNHASSPAFVLLDMDQFQAGTDFNWKNFRLGAGYTDDRSSLFSYYSYNATESYSLNPTLHSRLSFNLGQQWTYYPANGNAMASHLTFYDYELHYGWSISSRMDVNAEGGWQQQHGEGINQDMYVGRVYFNWNIGQLRVNLGYEFNEQDNTGIGLQRNYAFLKIRRSF
ncbi:MAG TPA: hypothetical protein VK742_14475 [Candidatus Sulfotelmatobacter sp.]|jgi:hypothetical protein|nr:hypothetical protein [Candidatus Sulfotelmatobacter sp.]